MKKPTLKQKVQMYEDFLHLLDLMSWCGDPETMSKLIRNASAWSYAHRVGNGEYSEKEQQKIIDQNFWKLTKI